MDWRRAGGILLGTLFLAAGIFRYVSTGCVFSPFFTGDADDAHVSHIGLAKKHLQDFSCPGDCNLCKASFHAVGGDFVPIRNQLIALPILAEIKAIRPVGFLTVVLTIKVNVQLFRVILEVG
jgi:hypothetical protein